MNIVGIILTLILSAAVFVLPRRSAVFAVLAAICYVTQGQMLNVGGFHFTTIRIVLLVSLIRSVARGELRDVKLNQLDWLLIAYTLLSAMMPGIRTGTWQESIGNAYNTILSYFAFRCLITSWEDVEELLPKLAIFVIPMALCMLLEMETGHSLFAFMGGLPEVDPDRNGHFRAACAFRGPHCAGAFGATLLPLFTALYWVNPERRPIAIVGMIAATAITYASNSSGPLMAYLASLIGLAFWPLREHMKKVRWGIVAFLIYMGFTMKAPIWYLMAKVADLTGGDGWYRSYLMEQCYKHISDWWLMGTDDTSAWAVTHLVWGGADLCNMYVSCAASAGLGSMVLFIAILVKSFQRLGEARKRTSEMFPQAEVIFWCMGCILFAHVVTFFSVTYWDQMSVVWWGTVAIFGSVTSSVMESQPVAEIVEESPEADAPNAGLGAFETSGN